MVNEAQLRQRMSDPVDFTVADGAGIEKGTLCKISDPRTAAASDGAGDRIAGIAAREKIANDGRTQLALYVDGIFDMYASGAIAVGDPVMSAGVNNEVKSAAAVTSGAAVIGYALETATDQETVQIMFRVGAGGGG